MRAEPQALPEHLAGPVVERAALVERAVLDQHVAQQLGVAGDMGPSGAEADGDQVTVP
ncbi:hypothetical protein [Streptomyces sp. PT12]|uniref:hypothetical protein n=1 Tax=Streptomyces sp. PT12 TaxID=1510197 RepID=UPI0015EF6B53|nr:hypothetical protein [Streptomyces sp. PT12]